MRMRRVGWAVDYLQEAGALVREPEAQRGKWNPDGKELHLELGCGKGRYSQEMAALYPEKEFVAVEVNETAAGKAARLYDETGLENLSLIHGDARNLEAWFGNGEVDVIHLNFSDPWPKKRNAKRRLSAPGFLETYRAILSENGRVEMKTDNPDLFEYSLIQFLDAGFRLQDVSVSWRRNEHPEDAMTEYEQKFVEEGKPIYRLVVGV